jgi:hypothetical protein
MHFNSLFLPRGNLIKQKMGNISEDHMEIHRGKALNRAHREILER